MSFLQNYCTWCSNCSSVYIFIFAILYYMRTHMECVLFCFVPLYTHVWLNTVRRRRPQIKPKIHKSKKRSNLETHVSSFVFESLMRSVQFLSFNGLSTIQDGYKGPYLQATCEQYCIQSTKTASAVACSRALNQQSPSRYFTEQLERWGLTGSERAR